MWVDLAGWGSERGSGTAPCEPRPSPQSSPRRGEEANAKGHAYALTSILSGGREGERKESYLWAQAALISNVRLVTGLPSMAISTLYLPAGQSFGLRSLKVVVAGPSVAMVWLMVVTSWPLPSR